MYGPRSSFSDSANDGLPTLGTRDTTCTVPYIYSYGNFGTDPGGKQEFLGYELDDGGPTGIDRATEGHFEMIEMGTVTNTTPGSSTSAGGSAWAATHVAGSPPSSLIPGIGSFRPCGQLVDAWTDPDNTVALDEGYWLKAPTTDLTAPSGGLFGGAAVVNTGGGAMYSYDATAINGFAASLVDVSGFIPLHQQPGFIIPGLNSGDTLTATVFNSNGTLSTQSHWRGVDAVSYVFMHDQLMNEYTTESVIGAGTEWVITFPTKQFYVFADQTGLQNPPLAPFTSWWDDTLTDFSAEACEVVVLDTIWDREERRPGDDPGTPVPPIVSPAPPDIIPDGKIPFKLCFETSVIRFGSEDGIGARTEILGSTNFHNIDNDVLNFEFGWARLQLADWPELNADGTIKVGGKTFHRRLSGPWGTSLEGLPVSGFAVQRFENAFVGAGAGLLASYGGIYDHKYTRRVGSFFCGVQNEAGCLL